MRCQSATNLCSAKKNLGIATTKENQGVNEMIQPTDTERLTKCVNVCVIGRMCHEYYWNGIHWCHANNSTVCPLGCPTADRNRASYNESLKARRLSVGRPTTSIVCRHREPIEGEVDENDCQTICFDCEATHQLSCLCWGQNGVPEDCPTYNARRAIVEGEPTSRYDTHQELSNGQIELKVGFPTIEE